MARQQDLGDLFKAGVVIAVILFGVGLLGWAIANAAGVVEGEVVEMFKNFTILGIILAVVIIAAVVIVVYLWLRDKFGWGF